MKPTILVAEDRTMMSAILIDELTQMGWEVHLAQSGEAAWTLWQVGSFDALSTDYDMPGLNGLQLTQLVLGRGSARVIMFSGSDEQEEAFKTAGGEQFYSKSDLGAYLKKMKSLLGELKNRDSECDCQDCVDSENPCHGDCSDDLCQGCQEAEEDRKDQEFEAKKSQGIL